MWDESYEIYSNVPSARPFESTLEWIFPVLSENSSRAHAA